MKITLVAADGKKTKVALSRGATIEDLAAKFRLSSQAFLFSKNNKLCLETDFLEDGDEVELIRVVSGG